MLEQKIMSVHAGLGEVLGAVRDEKLATILRACRENLKSVAEQAEALEKHFTLEGTSYGQEKQA